MICMLRIKKFYRKIFFFSCGYYMIIHWFNICSNIWDITEAYILCISYVIKWSEKMSHNFQICPIDFALHGDNVPYDIFTFKITVVVYI